MIYRRLPFPAAPTPAFGAPGVCAMTTTTRRDAFTLIELLVVIAIIALLISILLPALRWARESGRTVVCMSNMKQIGDGLGSYANDYKNRIWESGFTTPQRRYWYAQPENPNLPPSGTNPVIAGPAFEYLQDVD